MYVVARNRIRYKGMIEMLSRLEHSRKQHYSPPFNCTNPMQSINIGSDRRIISRGSPPVKWIQNYLGKIYAVP